MDMKKDDRKDAMDGENSDVVAKNNGTKIAIFNAPRNWDKNMMRKFVEEKNFEDVASVRHFLLSRFIIINTHTTFVSRCEKYPTKRLDLWDSRRRKR